MLPSTIPIPRLFNQVRQTQYIKLLLTRYDAVSCNKVNNRVCFQNMLTYYIYNTIKLQTIQNTALHIATGRTLDITDLLLKNADKI